MRPLTGCGKRGDIGTMFQCGHLRGVVNVVTLINVSMLSLAECGERWGIGTRFQCGCNEGCHWNND